MNPANLCRYGTTFGRKLLSTTLISEAVLPMMAIRHASIKASQMPLDTLSKDESLKDAKTSADGTESTFPTKAQLARLVERTQVLGVSAPVRAEFIREKPLNLDDLVHIDIKEYHRKPESVSDHVAFRIVKFLRFFADQFFRKRYVHRAIVLETVAGVPGMVAGMTCHLRSLRRMQNDSGWIEKLLHEAENERMHLMIWMTVTQPTRLERALVLLVQGVFFNVYTFFYMFFPRTAHRM
ncbi:Ubiquinol oxidase, partial [Aphelenchoides avenae]